MKRTLVILLMVPVAALFITSCAGSLAVENSFVQPEAISPGDQTSFHVVMKGPIDNVSKVIGTVREYPEYVMELNNNGEQGDETAGDNIWSVAAPIPWEAPSGAYHIEIRVLDKDGNELVTEGFEEQINGKSGAIIMNIQ